MTIRNVLSVLVGLGIWFGIKAMYPDTEIWQRAIVVFGGVLTLWVASLAFRKSNG